MLSKVSTHQAKLKELGASIQSRKQQMLEKAAGRRPNLDNLKERFTGAVQAVKKQL
ncbi:hypothetical protein [Virgibacillus senegalensis]|uniref:hypothetical protein n=1 Tax=Virgibacillus senegalensis TaxID=1499679 RepID=UPI000AC95887|nr:hypothetical protein [Virgibacillus senegalensis]